MATSRNDKARARKLLRIQATLFAAGRIETSALDQVVQGSHSPKEKLDALIVGSDKMVAAHETEFRSLLRLSVETGIDGARSAAVSPRVAVLRSR